MAKFSNEQTLRFDRESMEQATHSAIASYHASKYPKGVTVVDGTAGLGGDAMALEQRGPVIAIENDPSRIEFAKHNLSPLGVEVLQGDVAEYLAIHHPDYVWLDPARRTQTGKRITKLADYLPSPLTLWKSLESCTLVGIKCSPMTSDEELLTVGKRLEFVSFERECREAVVWHSSNPTTIEPGTFAVMLKEGLEPLILEQEETEGYAPMPGKYLYDCDPAAIRAHALGSFGLDALGDSPGYLTGDEVIDSPWLRRYEVLYAGPGDVKKTKVFLRQHGLRVFEVKQRGAGVDPQLLLRALKTEGTPCSLVAWKVGKSVRYALTLNN
jgi:hypothetical protein